MGNASSRDAIYWRLDRVLPGVTDIGLDDKMILRDRGLKVFKDASDREQFIHAIVTVMTANGDLDLRHAEFRLFYSRRQVTESQSSAVVTSSSLDLFNSTGEEEESGDRLVATLVAFNRDGVIFAKIMPDSDGRDQAEAFRAFRKHVEIRLDQLLQSVPHAHGLDAQRSVNADQTPGSSARSSEINGEYLPGAPPAYGDVKQG